MILGVKKGVCISQPSALSPGPQPWPPALAANLYLPALAPNLYLPTLAPTLCLPQICIYRLSPMPKFAYTDLVSPICI